MLLTINFPGNVITHDYAWLFVVAILSLALTVILRSPIYALLEVILLGALYFSLATTSVFFYPLMGIQIILAIILPYNLMRAINHNYQLIMEKTHQVPRKITRHNYTGLK